MAHNVLMRIIGDQCQEKNVNHAVDNPQIKQKFLADKKINQHSHTPGYICARFSTSLTDPREAGKHSVR